LLLLRRLNIAYEAAYSKTPQIISCLSKPMFDDGLWPSIYPSCSIVAGTVEQASNGRFAKNAPLAWRFAQLRASAKMPRSL
jgi:hypothetical protein